MPTIDLRRNKKILKEIPILNNEQIYIYVLENSPTGNIKIGKTTNLKQRIQSLSGSNGAGNEIVRCFYSQPTYLHTLEAICHDHFHYARFLNSEWFDGTKVKFEEVVKYLEGLLSNNDYERCNEVRKAVMQSGGFLVKKEKKE
jgi:hypothetical protein